MSLRLSIAVHVRAGVLALLLAGSVYPPLALLGLVAVPFVVWELRRSLPKVLFILPLFAALVLPVWLHESTDPYGRDKFADIVTFALLAALGAGLLRDRAHVLAFARTWLVIGAALAVVALFPLRSRLVEPDLAWVVASALVTLVWLAGGHQLWWEAAAAAGSLMSVSLLATGERGAFAAAVAGGALLLAARTPWKVFRIVAVALAALAVLLLLAWTPMVRSATWPVLRGRPEGVGWGNWSAYTGVWSERDPHDLWLEVATEAGWVPAVLVLAAVIWVLVRLWRAAHAEPAAVLVFGLLVCEALAVSVSGTVTARTFWAFLAAGTLVTGWTGKAEATASGVDLDVQPPVPAS